MEFDINLILVPVTLVFLVVWLADKFWLKQYKLAKNHSREYALAETHLAEKRAEFAAVLKTHYGADDVDYFVPGAATPLEVTALHNEYQSAKRRFAECGGQTNATQPFFLVRWAYEFLPVLAFLVIVRAFIVEPFNIPSSSMVPTLYTGDFILVNKAAYGLRLPITHTQILATGNPKHGDVVVFRYPLYEKRYYIKRVIGLPGDTVRYDRGVLSINGEPIDTQKINYSMDTKLVNQLYAEVIQGQRITESQRAALGQAEEQGASYRQETLGEHTYTVRYTEDMSSHYMASFLQQVSPELKKSQGQTWQVTVPQGQYFVMGDNRERSEDSRVWGFVEQRHLAGKATYIWMHKDAGLKLPSFSRAGKID